MPRSSKKENQTKDLLALAAAAQGRVTTEAVDRDREARIAELKARYKRGELSASPDQLARKIIDAHLKRQ
jgi:anti-sigma28 factor (negative regulator of flagellin synthesis)